ncbi:bifunctional 4-hydroxy-2-oxoglutarate aldolase/2-dehydro-3-deoxy-phosphogluconate aldolase [Rubrobacter tropicus]|uniref:Bifunctional 4-hydroxy-2-oxoglutarate aldolase/2-dehydro-3-deoxy-phosphogluconate aldolase n=1 Tax=Rubrobacter tropicus TaxID=2653851 RepID=A0A6G8Q6U8_9ACTN|nr:bifunctional 4-hydroxy-2-oxoglutarate aldolase/2-dehydro-3-deoxy-phosphogluconate aldolase [Rubrobacter tropicus]QIN82205.1 bifunctional 4-hydroxy-2-oxoglutarate aldolase/2-dehydro-3-deoxy-phosphogluconate aldolase [Rubrobacter tropicus]
MGSDQVLKKTGELGLLAVVRGESRQAAMEVVGALVEGGVLGIEVTFTTPEAPQVIRDLGSEYGDDILLGAGTVITPEQVAQAAEAGSAFLVSPGCDPDLLPTMLETGLLVLPGVLTPSEVMLARRLGAPALKFFPGSSGGPSHLKALLGPFPDVSFIPTGGVSADNVSDWFAAGALAVGAGSALAPPSLAGRDRAEVVENARRFAEAVRTARKR